MDLTEDESAPESNAAGPVAVATPGTRAAGDAEGGPAEGAGDEGPGDPAAPRPPEEPMRQVDDPEHPGRSLTNLVGWAVVAACCVGVFASLHPEWILRTTTPTGGDMGAHVWGPAFLRDELLPSWRLTGWTPDWYAGFPAFVFYMVVPMLAIVALATSPPLWLSPLLLAGVAALAVLVHRRVASPVLRTLAWIVLAVVGVLCLPVPYEVAFKLVAVSGLVAMPAAAYALGRGARLAFPLPPLLAVGAAAFLYESGYSILGGNILSTMAGEFAFAISLALSLVYFGVLLRGSRTGFDRALGAVLFALVLLCHVIPAIFAVVGTAVLLVTRREDRTPWWDRSAIGRWVAGGLAAAVLLILWWQPSGFRVSVGDASTDLHWFPLVATAAAVALLVAWDRRVLVWGLVAGPVGALVASFWALPLIANSTYMNDMGWEKYTQYAAYLWPQPAQFDMPYRNVVFTLAALGVLLSLVHRVRLGWWLTLMVVVLAWAFRYFPQYRLWNARLLPFYYLALYLLAALAVALVIRSVALVVGELQRRRDEPTWVGVTGAVAALLVVAVAIGGALRGLPGGEVATDPSTGETTYRWLGFDFRRQNNASGWALYNFQGLEERDAHPEFRAVVDMMASVGEEEGCGRTMWEYESQLDRFGTPMALMLLPYFTDGCIGSMEGLYFESSTTTPFHFLNQSELSPSPSRAQRDMPYGEFDLEQGISHLQMFGVRYYLASSAQATDAARADDRLTEVASTGPWDDATGASRTWTVFRIDDSALVAPLQYEPVVLTDADDHIDGWVYDLERQPPAEGQALGPKTAGPAVEWYLDPTRWDVPIATSGPDDWPRAASTDPEPPREPVRRPARVSAVEQDVDRISFRVDRPGSPVVVRASYFPNWKVEGGEGPYRISPNLMAVVPTEREVTLTYGTTWVDRFSRLLTVVGLALVGWLAVVDQRRRDHGTGAPDGRSGDGPSGDGDPDPDVAADDGPGGGRAVGDLPDGDRTHAADVAGPGPATAGTGGAGAGGDPPTS